MASKSNYKKIVNITANSVLARNARVAANFVSRLVGLLASPPLQPGEGLLIDPCSSIHMFGMQFPIDAVFFDKQWLVVGVVEGIAPGQISRAFPSARCCLELPSGTIADTGTKVGDRIEVEEAVPS